MRKTVIYIAGYGRSGSTLLERVLGSHEKIFGVGELASFLDLLDSETPFCSCGELLQKCKFWSEVIKSSGGDFQNNPKLKVIQRRFESLAVFSGPFFRRNKETYRRYTQRLFGSIFEQLPNEVSYIVDSSKTSRKSFFRPIALRRIASLNVKIIHLVRDGRGCMWSNLKGSNRRMEVGLDPHIPFAAIRTVISWPLANLGAHLFQLCFPHDYLRVRYEDLVSDPASTLKSIGTFLGVSLDQQIEMLLMRQHIPLGHQVAGNRLRMERKIVLRVDDEWQAKLGRWREFMF